MTSHPTLADQKISITPVYKISVNTAVIKGSDVLTGADGVYEKFTGQTPSDTKTNSTTSGKIRIEDGGKQLIFKQVNPRLETNIRFSVSQEIFPSWSLAAAVSLSSSSVSYSFVEGIGILIDPARLDYKSYNADLGISVIKSFSSELFHKAIIAPFVDIGTRKSITRLQSALIDVESRQLITTTGYGARLKIHPVEVIPIEIFLKARTNSINEVLFHAGLEYCFEF
jgi:hypothetical protein